MFILGSNVSTGLENESVLVLGKTKQHDARFR